MYLLVTLWSTYGFPLTVKHRRQCTNIVRRLIYVGTQLPVSFRPASSTPVFMCILVVTASVPCRIRRYRAGHNCLRSPPPVIACLARYACRKDNKTHQHSESNRLVHITPHTATVPCATGPSMNLSQIWRHQQQIVFVRNDQATLDSSWQITESAWFVTTEHTGRFKPTACYILSHGRNHGRCEFLGSTWGIQTASHARRRVAEKIR